MTKKNDTSKNSPPKKHYGEWTDRRVIALVDAMIAYHPYDRKKLEVSEAKKAVMRNVNEIDRDAATIYSWNTFQLKISNLIKEVTKKQLYDTTYGTGSNDSETYLEHRVMELKLKSKQLTSKTKEAETNTLLKKKRDQEALVAASKKGKHAVGQQTNTKQLDVLSLEKNECDEEAIKDKQAACVNPVPGLNRGIKRSIENLEQDRLQEKDAIKKMGLKIDIIEDMMKTVIKKQDDNEKLLHQALKGPVPQHPYLPRPIAPVQLPKQDDIKKQQ